MINFLGDYKGNNTNTLIRVVILVLINKNCLPLDFVNLEETLNFNPVNFNVPFYNIEFNDTIEKCEFYLTDHIEEITSFKIEALDIKLNEIL